MAYARSTFNIDAAKAGLADPQNRQFDVSFPYLDKTHVKVLVNGVETSSFSWVNDARVELTSAPVVNDVVVLVRETSPNSRLVDYQTGSVLSEEILDQDSLQGFYLSQEANDVKEITMAKNALDQWEGGNRKIQNLTDPADAQDAVTKNYLETVWLSTSDKTQLNSLNLTNLNTVATNVANVNTTAGSITNVNTVAGNIANVNTVAGNNTNVTTVAGINANVTTVATNIADVNTLATNIGDINTVENSIANVNTVATNLNGTNTIGTVAGSIANVNTVGGNNTNVTTVANNTTNINVVATNIADVQAVSGNNANVTAVAGNATNINAVAGNATNINTVAGNNANITTVAGVSSNVTTVATNVADLNTVAAQISNNNLQTIAADINAVITTANDLNEAVSEIDTVATHIANVDTVGTAITNVNTVATNISDVNYVATNMADVSNFADVYIGPAASAPTTRGDGSALQAGDIFFNTTDDQMKVYTGTAWQSLGSTVNGTAARFKYVATASQTTFSGNDANGATLAYDPGYIDVYLNGVHLDPSDYTATSGTDIVLASGAAASDELYVVAYGTFVLSAVVEQAGGTNGAAEIPVGTTAQRPTAATGQFRFNSTLGKFEGYNGSAWGAVGGGATGGGSDAVFIENDSTVSASYTVPTGKNAGTFGPITINSGVTVTVSTGSRWVIV